MPIVDFGILAALPEEFLVNQNVFTNLREVSENADSWYRMSVEAKGDRRYAIVASFMTEMGPLAAQDLTAKMIARWDPAYIILVGIAGSFNKDVRLGDVVVSQQVFYYDPGKADCEGVKYRPQGYPCSVTLIRQHEALTFDPVAFTAWQEAAKRSAAEKLRTLRHSRKSKGAAKNKQVSSDHVALKEHCPKVHFGTVSSGSLVVASKAKQRELLALHGKTLATEMEGAGVLHASFTQAEMPTPAVVVKGISDAADNDKASVDEKVFWRKLAAENSARLVFSMIERGRIRPLGTDQFELDLNRGDISEARDRIQGQVSVGMSLLAFPRLVKLIGPLTGIHINVVAIGTEHPLKVIEMLVEFKDRNFRQRKEVFNGSSEIEIGEPVTSSQIGIYLLIDGVPEQIRFHARAQEFTREAVWSCV